MTPSAVGGTATVCHPGPPDRLRVCTMAAWTMHTLGCATVRRRVRCNSIQQRWMMVTRSIFTAAAAQWCYVLCNLF